MYAALDAIGFAPVRHASRVVLFEPRHESVRQHMFVTVTIGGATYVIDPGFGPFACTLPIPIDGTPVPTSAPTHRLVREGKDWVLYVTRDGQQTQGWVSTMEEEYSVDFEMMNYYIATHPASSSNTTFSPALSLRKAVEHHEPGRPHYPQWRRRSRSLGGP
jgi:N-hydroxyarylamine O-acetyltransferase